MVVLRFLFRSFTPTFSLYKATLKTEQNQIKQLLSTGSGKQAQLSPEEKPLSLKTEESDQILSLNKSSTTHSKTFFLSDGWSLFYLQL